MYARVATLAAAMLLLASTTPAVAADGQVAIAAVERTTPTDAQLANASPFALLKAVIRCEQVAAGRQYCMHIGLMPRPLSDGDLDAMLRKAAAGPEIDGGVATLLGTARRFAAMPYDQRVAAERDEIAAAVRAPRVRLMSASAAPARRVMPMAMVEQETYWYCGPASVAAVAYGHSATASQGTWAYRLHVTESGGTSVSDIPAVLNYFTDRGRAGPYQAVSTGDTDANTYLSYVRAAIYERNHPAIQQVKLYKAYFPYLRVNHGGHFQAVNGYDTDRRTVIYDEVYNEATFTSGGAQTAGQKELAVSLAFAANQASYRAMPGVFGRLVM
ncbi:hypothetical protein [Fodinicola acaciae]|uniref:hypothetical protein n=1 Tax=Fodinicola acaciae TaxID=2681555 RepID=UPI0013D6D9C1|nr:hypothetical protein [Fodinicola acaciae]